MTTTEKANRPEAAGHPVSVPAPHDPTAPFYAVGGADPDFALPPRADSPNVGFWARILSPGRRA